jgi:diacylglycerol kinase (ATP)
MINKPGKLLFIINPGAGNSKTDWKKEISDYFSGKPHIIDLFELPSECNKETVSAKIRQSAADRVIAVGGDGTLKMVADILKETDTLMGLLPAGSANGMARELGIPADPVKAIDIITGEYSKKIHLVKINEELCIHLSDIGFNAFVVKKFEDEGVRGMWGYIKAAWKVLWSHNRMQIDIAVEPPKENRDSSDKIREDIKYIRRDAAMVVIANATKYGTGVLINPEGSLDDELFEVIIVKKISFSEIFKMRFTHRPYNPAKTELISTRSLRINSRHHVHFQVDGEYLGKTKIINASIIPHALRILVPKL